MPQLVRASIGTLFSDDFNNTSLDTRWVVTPSLSSRYSLTERPGYLRVKHSDSPTYIVTDIPISQDMMIEMKNDYKPVISTDIGGLVVFKTLADRVELVEYYDPVIDVSHNYLYMRLHRKGDMYDGYGSQDGITWELIGSARVEDAAKIGIVLNGDSNSLSKYLDIDYLAMYKDRFVYIENLEPNMYIEMYSSNNVLIDTQTVGLAGSVAKFDMFTLPVPFNGYFKLYSPSGVLLSQTVSTIINPGDEYQYIMNIKVKFQRQVITMVYDPVTNTTKPTTTFLADKPFILDDIINIGNLDGATIEGKVIIENLDVGDILSLECSIGQYANDFSTHAVQVSRDNMGTPQNYQDKVVLDVPALSSNFFWLKITASNIATLVKYDSFKYKLVFKNA